MRRIVLVIMGFSLLMLIAVVAFAKDATVNVSGESVDESSNQLAIAVTLPAEVVGRRIDRAILEVPIALGESVDSVFNDFPLIELFEDGSEAPKQTILLAKGFDGIARFDVTRFVRAWANTEVHGFVLGAVSEKNATTFQLGTVSLGSNGVKARLSIAYSERDGTNVSVEAE